MNRPYRDDELKVVAKVRRYVVYFEKAVGDGTLDYARELWDEVAKLCEALGELIVANDKGDV